MPQSRPARSPVSLTDLDGEPIAPTEKRRKGRAKQRQAPEDRERLNEEIEIVGAREHNLRIDHLCLPKRELIVFTGVSGSGKSSLAFDTLFAEGQRRYVESLSAYARQFLGRLDRPAVERLSGLSPTIAIEQKSASGNPRSTVGTITEIYDYLRLLYARIGVQHCPSCDRPVVGQSAEAMVVQLGEHVEDTALTLMAPLITHRKGQFRQLFEDLTARGFARIRLDGKIYRLDDLPPIDRHKKHDVQLVVDRIRWSPSQRARLTEAVELCLKEGEGQLWALLEDGRLEDGRLEDVRIDKFSEQRACCGQSFSELSPQNFSFNSPLGMCAECNGLGMINAVDPKLVVPDPTLSIRAGAIAPWANSMARGEGWRFKIIEAMAEACQVDLDSPFNALSKKKQQQVLYGLDGERLQVAWQNDRTGSQGEFGVRFEGVLNLLTRRMKETDSERMRQQYLKYVRPSVCGGCAGTRLRPESLAVRLQGICIAEVGTMTVAEAHKHFDTLVLSAGDTIVAESVLREVQSRLRFLLNVGLEYLTLERSGPSLSGGEAQRIRLASQLGSELSGVMYVLDEPSIGLHQRDNQRLIGTLEGLKRMGNTVIVVEHDEDTIRAAGHLVDFGPGAGRQGGEVIFSGHPSEIHSCPQSLTGQYLSGARKIPVPQARRQASDWLEIRGAKYHNLQDVDVRLPLSSLVAITGVSGAGKSSLINGILLPALKEHRAAPTLKNLRGTSTFKEIRGLQAVDHVIAIDQRPIGRTPRSNPGTYTKAFDEIRRIFAALPAARALGFNSGRFSFNVKGGRCEDCRGDGVVRVEMHFLADVYVPCELCAGRRYNAQTLSVEYQGRNIADILDTTVQECVGIFSNYPKLSRVLQTLLDVGLGYMQLGQPATTLSGGEAQRVKLSRELGKRQTGRTLYVLDEPTTGLHFEDISHLLSVLERLVDLGNTVLVIEHNLDVIKRADWVVDLGPEGGAGGGRVVVSGTPEQVAGHEQSHTGRFLAPLL